METSGEEANNSQEQDACSNLPVNADFQAAGALGITQDASFILQVRKMNSGELLLRSLSVLVDLVVPVSTGPPTTCVWDTSELSVKF